MLTRFTGSAFAGAALAVCLAIPAEASDMSTMKDLARQGIEMWNGDAAVDTSIFADSYVNWQEPRAHGSEANIDLETWAKLVETNHAAMPDLSVEILSQVGEGDRVATHWRFSGTQTGEYLGRPGSGKDVSWTGIQIDRIEDDKIAESWVVWDFYTMLLELGVVEPQ